MPDFGIIQVDNLESFIWMLCLFTANYSYSLPIYAGLRSVLPFILLCDQGQCLPSGCRGLAIKVCSAPPLAFSR